MAKKKSTPLFQLGDRVKIHHSEWRGRIVEFRGALGVGGAFVYRIRIPDKPKPIYIEVPEDELTAIPRRPKQESNTSECQAPEVPGQSGDGTPATLRFFQKGDRVKIRETNWQGRIVELRIPSAPGRGYVYRVRVPAEPRSIYLEIPDIYLLAVPKPSNGKNGSSTRQRARSKQKRKAN